MTTCLPRNGRGSPCRQRGNRLVGSTIPDCRAFRRGSSPLNGSLETLDDLDDLVGPIALSLGQRDQLSCPGNQ
jgi:hypothetical protein